MKLYLIRHGETDWNKEGRLQGRRDIPMNSRGIAQAERTGDVLRGMVCAGAEGPEKLLIVSSPLRRAKACAEIIAEKVGVAKDEIITEPLLIERSFGRSEGEIWQPQMREHEQENEWESMDALAERAKAVIEKYIDREEQIVILAAHGAILKAVQAVLSKEKLAYGDNSSAVRQGCIVAAEIGSHGSDIELIKMTEVSVDGGIKG